MGRSEAPLSRDRREETPGEANSKPLAAGVSKMPSSAETLLPRSRDEKLRGVESKFNEHDPATGNSIQTTLLSTSSE